MSAKPQVSQATIKRAVCADAAERKVEKLRAALRPFAEALEGNFAEQEEDHVDLWESPAASVITYGDLRRARAALAETENSDEAI